MQKKLKICIVGPAFPLRGGIANFNEALYFALEKAGHEVEIVSFSLQYPAFLFPGKTQLAVGDSPKNIRVSSKINSVGPASWIKTANYIRKQQPDLLLIRFWLPFMGPALGSIARMVSGKKIKVIGLTDNVIPHERKPGDKALSAYFLNSCDGFITLSASVAKDLEKFVKKPLVKVMPHPIYDIFGEAIEKQSAREVLGFKPNDKLVLFFGFIRKYKGLDLLLKAMAKVNRDVQLLVAGEFYDEKEPYITLIKEHNLEHRVHFYDSYIPEAEVKNYFCAADLVAQTYRTATQSGVAQIAYHFGKPLLVTNVGGLAEIVDNGKSGFVTEVDPDAIAIAINRFYDQNKEREFAANVNKEKDRYSWKHFCLGVENLYEQLLSQNKTQQNL